MNNKRIVVFSILALLAVATIAVSLFLSAVHLVATDSDKAVVYDKTISLLDYFKDGPFVSTAAGDTYFQSSGPVWMATGSLMLLTLPALLGIITFVLCILEICFYKANNLNVKNNVLAKKFSIFAGLTTLVCSAFAIISFAVTTMMANGYMEFGLTYGPFVLALVGIVSIILACVSCKREKEQQTTKIKNSLGFALVALFASVCAAIPFLPFYTDHFLGQNVTTMWETADMANELQTDANITNMLGDYPFGFAQWAIIVFLLVCAFVFVYAMTGFIRALAGKTTNWLSSRVKRWTMTLAVTFNILLFLVLCQIGVLASTLVYVVDVDKIFMLTASSIVYVVLPFIPYILSTIISVDKNQKRNNRCIE